MAEETKTTSSTKLIAACAVCLLAGCAMCYYFFFPKLCPDCPDSPDCPTCPVVTPIAYFDSEDIAGMLGATDAVGVRFYLASSSAGVMSSLAGPYKSDGTHVAGTSGELSFGLYEKLVDTYADLRVLGETDAIAAVEAASTTSKPGWSIDATSASLRAILSATDCNGIGIVERITTDEAWTFDLAPVMIRDGRALVIGGITEMEVGLPCPMYCGRDEAVFLHRRD